VQRHARLDLQQHAPEQSIRAGRELAACSFDATSRCAVPAALQRHKVPMTLSGACAAPRQSRHCPASG
jgi:hypothetical protein